MLLGVEVVAAEREDAVGRGAEERGVDEPAHAGRRGGVDHRAVQRDAVGVLGRRGQEEDVDAVERARASPRRRRSRRPAPPRRPPAPAPAPGRARSAAARSRARPAARRCARPARRWRPPRRSRQAGHPDVGRGPGEARDVLARRQRAGALAAADEQDRRGRGARRARSASGRGPPGASGPTARPRAARASAAAAISASRPGSAITGSEATPTKRCTSIEALASSRLASRPSSVWPAAPSSFSGAPVAEDEPGAELERRPVVLGARRTGRGSASRARARRTCPRAPRAPRRRTARRCSTVADVAARHARRRAAAGGRRAAAGRPPRRRRGARGPCRSSAEVKRDASAPRCRRAAASERACCDLERGRLQRERPRSAARRAPTRRAAAARAAPRISSRGGVELASGSASATSCGSVPSVCGATRIARSGIVDRRDLLALLARLLELLLDRRAEPVVRVEQLQQRPGHERRDERHDHEHREQRLEVITPFSSARLSTISSVRPRVFISVPSTADSRQPSPVTRAASIVPPNLHDDRHHRAARP